MVTIHCNGVQFNQVEAVLIDKDGTLARVESYLRQVGQRRSRLIDAKIPGVQEPLLMAFGVSGQQLDPAGILAVATRLETEIAAAAYVAETGRGWVEALELVRAAFVEAEQGLGPKASQTPPCEGIEVLLTHLKQANVRIGVLSSDTQANVQEFLDHCGLSTYVDAVMGTDGAIAKPDPRLMTQACESLGVAPQSTLVIGDSDADLVMAARAKANGSIGVTWGWQQSVALTQAGAIATHPSQIQAKI
ncbi:MAG: HAD family hydrolase [Kaiparowitsia implicata GSE-PSE-MK54-09C]|nr:HAD family hydrolase [Kaiparowitsia implicata GSE-PSE-MK54-09C]